MGSTGDPAVDGEIDVDSETGPSSSCVKRALNTGDRATHDKSQVASNLCVECHLETFVYQCPACHVRTCSLLCCRRHKDRTKCTGKRSRTSFLPLGNMDDHTIQSDYHFLEDVIGVVDQSKRLGRTLDVGNLRNNSHSRSTFDSSKRACLPAIEELDLVESHPLLLASNESDQMGASNIIPLQQRSPTQATCHPKWRSFQQFCREYRGIELLLMPPMMARHTANRSHMLKSTKHRIAKTQNQTADDKTLSSDIAGTNQIGSLVWTIEWRIHGTSKCHDDSIPNKLTHNVPERTILKEVWENEQKNQSDKESRVREISLGSVSEREDSGGVVLLRKVIPCSARAPKFVMIQSEATLLTLLHNTTVIEYPTIEVVPIHRISEFPLAIAEMMS
jgi:ABC-type transporter Mla MlaB component